MRRAFALLVILVLAAMAGCFGPKASPVDVLLANPLLVAAPGRGGDLVVVASSTLAFKQTLPVHSEGLPANWSLEIEKTSLDIAGQKRVAFIVHVAPGNATTYGLHDFDLMIGDSRATAHVFLDNLTTNATRHALTLLAANGSVIATDDAAIRDNPDLKAAPGELPVGLAPPDLLVGESKATREGENILLLRAVG